MKRAKNVCETCASWSVHTKEIRGPRQGFGLKGYCRFHFLVTGDSGHCASHERAKKEVLLNEVAA